MSKAAITSRINIRERLRVIRKELQDAQEILSRATGVRPVQLPNIQEERVEGHVTTTPGLLERLKEIREEIQEAQNRLSRSHDVTEEDTKLLSIYTPGARPINNYLWWFSVKTWFQAGFPAPKEAENPELTEDLIQRLLKASREIGKEVFKGIEELRDARRVTVNSKEYRDLTANQVLIILEKFTEVMLVKKQKIKEKGERPESATDSDDSFGTVIFVSDSVDV